MTDRKYSTATSLTAGVDVSLATLLAIKSGANVLIPVSSLLALVTKATLGLDKVDNTADNEKPVSTEQAQAISTAVDNLATTIQQELLMSSSNYSEGTTGAAIDALDNRMTNFESSQGSNDSIQYQQLMDTINSLSSQIANLSTPELVMPIALAKIDSVFSPGPAFSLPICFDDMVILDIDFSLGEAATTGDTVLDIFYTYAGTTTSILTSPLVIIAGDTVCNGPITSLVGGAEVLQSVAGTRLSGVFTSVGTGAKTPVLTLKWSKQ